MRMHRMMRLESVVLSRDGAALVETLGRPGVTGLRVWQEGAIKLEYHGGHWTGGDATALATVLAESGVEVAAVMDVEVLCGPTMAATRPTTEPMRGPGLFFRPGDGSPVDLWGLHGGGTVFLCLNGPSFDEDTRLLLEHRPGIVTFCVNNGAHGFRPDLWTCMDAPERFMESIWRDGRIAKFVPMEHRDRGTVRVGGDRDGDGKAGGDVGGPRVADCPNVWGYWRNDHFRAAQFLTEATVNWGNHKHRGGGRSVMLAALRIAWELGFRRVVLVGCDFEMSERCRYWFPEDRTAQAIRNNRTTYARLRGYFRELLPVFAAAGLEVVNATPGSSLEVFPRVDLSTELRRTRLSTAATTRGMYG